MSDLVKRLRERQGEYVEGQMVAPCDGDALDAADRIEALEAVVEAARGLGRAVKYYQAHISDPDNFSTRNAETRRLLREMGNAMSSHELAFARLDAQKGKSDD